MELVSSASKKFIVIKMEDNDFIDLEPLQPCFKKTVNGIRQMQWLHFEIGSPYTLFYKKKCSGRIGNLQQSGNEGQTLLSGKKSSKFTSTPSNSE